MGRMKAQGALMFNVITESHKVLSLYQRDPPKLTLRHNEEDLMMLPFEDSQVGFFMLLCRGVKSFADDNFTYVATQGHELETYSTYVCNAALADTKKHRAAPASMLKSASP